jgi:hypothetical protein
MKTFVPLLHVNGSALIFRAGSGIVFIKKAGSGTAFSRVDLTLYQLLFLMLPLLRGGHRYSKKNVQYFRNATDANAILLYDSFLCALKYVCYHSEIPIRKYRYRIPVLQSLPDNFIQGYQTLF